MIYEQEEATAFTMLRHQRLFASRPKKNWLPCWQYRIESYSIHTFPGSYLDKKKATLTERPLSKFRLRYSCSSTGSALRPISPAATTLAPSFTLTLAS